MATSHDPLIRAQDVKRCRLCPQKHRKSLAEITCRNCEVNLCKDCVNTHLKSNPDIIHEVVTLKYQNSEFNIPKCRFHEEQDGEEFCLACKFPVCRACLTSGSHQNHPYERSSKLLASNRNLIEKDNNELVTDIVPMYESILSDVETMLKEVKQKHAARRHSIENLGTHFSKLVDSVIKRYAQETKKNEETDTRTLVAFKTEIQKRLSLIQSAIKTNDSTLVSKDSSKLIHYFSQNEYFKSVPTMYELKVTKFNPVELTEQEICQMIDVISETIKKTIPMRVLKNGNLMPRRRFIDEPTVIKNIKSGYNTIDRVNCIPNTNEFYIMCDSVIIKHMNTKMEVLNEIKSEAESTLYDMTVTREGHILCTESRSNRINIMTEGRIQCLFALQEWVPLGICSTSTNGLLVSMKCKKNNPEISKVVRYYGSAATQEIRYDNERKDLYINPVYIEENRNLDIIVSDSDEKKVVVVDKDGQFRFSYDGNLQSKRYTTFTPRGLTTNSLCHILIFDRYNHVIHVIDKEGEFLFYIENCDLKAPSDLSTDSDDNLFVAECMSGTLKIIKLFE
ncbi:uncharacterized protein LOC134253834 [Saccostrea cucullata]|uniref:uncharacterized protein LOC134253834 n=1 Tax=Saccostrea cuccullata TaxID=36930 RepID=UPI002ED16133